MTFRLGWKVHALDFSCFSKWYLSEFGKMFFSHLRENISFQIQISITKNYKVIENLLSKRDNWPPSLVVPPLKKINVEALSKSIGFVAVCFEENIVAQFL